ncbi:hypothetical protein SO802_018343 [Lithocarpus litseifolius]|uniref:Maternal effect embryo arrest 60 n=1 Tax=Lithocarpus litseifolius TaxID=425828 RepID=A0AAW2CNX4_9ROSI
MLFFRNRKNVSSSSSSALISAATYQPQMSDVSTHSRRKLTTTSIHIMALDSIVNVNSLFTLALFLGLTWYPTTNPKSVLIDSASCAAGSAIAEDLIAFHVYSFSSFLFSSLIALALKQAIKITTTRSSERRTSGGTGAVSGTNAMAMGHLNTATLRAGMLVSATGSVFGCGFLMMALVDLVQIKLGVLGCGSLYTYAAIGPLVILVPVALVVYVFLVLHAFTR